MEKSYRDLFDNLTERAAAQPELCELLSAIEQVDDLDPLRIASLRAMKRIPAPPINLGYAQEEGKLNLYARNTVRKRKAAQPTLCAQIPATAWLFDAAEPFPGSDPGLRERFIELVLRSFGYLETRVANYFELGHDSKLLPAEGIEPALSIRPG